MKRFSLFAAALLIGSAAPAIAGHHEGGKDMKAGHHDSGMHKKSGTIVDTAVKSPQHKTLVAAVKAADLVDALSGKGPFTVFAPTDQAFGALPDGALQTLLKPEYQSNLQAVLKYHVVPGRVLASDLVGQIQKNGGTAELTTLEGSKLKAMLDGGNVVLTDENGGKATVVTADLAASNGVVHVTNAVSMPD